MGLVPAKLAKLMVLDNKSFHTIFIQESNGPRHFPIEIGLFEAVALLKQLEREEMARPMTHDLASNLVSALGGTIKEVHITELRRSTFYAEIIVETEEGEVSVDSRPSDALVLAASCKCTLFVNEDIFKMHIEQV